MRRLTKMLAAGITPVAVLVPTVELGSQTTGPAAAATPATFYVGAAIRDFTPPLYGVLAANDPADCIYGTPLESLYDGPRAFAFEEPYFDAQGSGHYDLGDPFVDCAHSGRWEGNFIGGGTGNPRYYIPRSDPQAPFDHVGARAIAVRNEAGKTIVVEVLDQEGVFDTYQQRIRDLANSELGSNAVGPDIFISATHDESAPDSLGLGGASQVTSGTNQFYVDYMVQKSADAIVAAVDSMRPATIEYAEAIEPANLRQCWSSYPYVDDQLMPVMQAIDASGNVIATLASVSQHTETLGFNGTTLTGNNDKQYQSVETSWLSADWPFWFRTVLEARYRGSVGIEMAGSVGSNETPEVFADAVSRTPEQHIDERHPAGCSTLFEAPTDPLTQTSESPVGTGFYSETEDLGTGLADAVVSALSSTGTVSQSDTIWGERADICVPLKNVLFSAAAAAGVFAERQGYGPGCKVALPATPNGSTTGTSVQSQVAAFRIGDGEFMSVPGEVFPYTYLGSFLGPSDLQYPQYPMTPMLMAHMHAPYRFTDGLAEDMLGYIFSQGNAVGIPGQHDLDNQFGTSDRDRFGCGHSDDSEATGSKTGDIIGDALAKLLDEDGRGSSTQTTAAEDQEIGRYVLLGGSSAAGGTDYTLSRDPLGSPGSLQCDVNNVFAPAADGPAIGVWLASPAGADGQGTVHILGTGESWMSLSGRRQAVPDRNTRGWIDATGARHWLNVFPDEVSMPSRFSLSSLVVKAQAAAGRIETDAGNLPGAVKSQLPGAVQSQLP